MGMSCSLKPTRASLESISVQKVDWVRGISGVGPLFSLEPLGVSVQSLYVASPLTWSISSGQFSPGQFSTGKATTTSILQTETEA